MPIPIRRDGICRFRPKTLHGRFVPCKVTLPISDRHTQHPLCAVRSSPGFWAGSTNFLAQLSCWSYVEAMSGEPDIYDLARQVAVLEERMNTSFERLRADIAQRDVEAAKRETRMLLVIAGMLGLAVAVIGFLI